VDGVWGFVAEVLLSGAVGASLLAIAAYLGRNQLAHWMAKDLEATKAKHQRELEVYKVSLVAETERAKASQDLKKASALRILEKKFAALDAYHKASAGCASDLLSTARLPATSKDQGFWNQSYERVQKLRETQLGLELFLNLEQKRILLNYRQAMIDVLPFCQAGSSALAGAQQQQLQDAALASELRNDDLVRELAEDLQKLM